jgi:thioredoxin-related protein
LNTSGFKRLGRKQFIPLKVALYKNADQDPKAKEEYHRLSEEYGIDAVPSFVILESDGKVISKPDILKPRKDVSSF